MASPGLTITAVPVAHTGNGWRCDGNELNHALVESLSTAMRPGSAPCTTYPPTPTPTSTGWPITATDVMRSHLDPTEP